MEIPDGKYRGKAKSGVPQLIESAKGTPGVAVEMVFTAPEMAGALLGWTGWLSDGAFDRTVESLRHMGWTGTDLDQITGLDTNEVELVVQAEEYEGKKYPRIQFINRIGSPLGVPMTADKAKTFAAAMRDRIKALDAAGGRKPAPRTSRPVNGTPPSGPPEPPPLTDKDIPF